MNERRQDFELLQRFTRHGEESAFAEAVRQHIDLVFATALRKVEDAGAAEEVAQNVFAVLARKAWQFAPDDSLPAWLHKAALLESKSWLRGEVGRRRREQTAAELGTTMKSTEDQPAFNALVPLLDDALLSLREKDRTALLSRFYESQSLRNVGATIGASEDTAQERVQSALEKVAEFFKRRGFKTASVAVATAALEHTAVTASASLVNTIVGTALPAAPAPAGFGLLLARLAGLTKVQTAALCVALAAGPVGWQVKERHTAGEKAKWMREQLLRARSDSSAAQAETERLRVDSSNLEQSLAQVNEAAQAYEAWKKDALAQLTAADYRWSDDLPFVRIPKEILPELSELIRIPTVSPPGVVNEYVIDLLCLTPAERQAMEEIFQRVAELQSGEKADVYETELSAKGRVVASRLFTTEPAGKSGPEAEQRFARMLDDIRGILGEERWPLLPSRLRSVNCEVLNHMLIPEPGTKVSASVENDENGIPQAKWAYSGEMSKVANPGPRSEKAPAGNVYSLNVVGYMNSSAALSAFLPDSNPDQRKRATSLGGVPAPEVLRQRAAAWFQEQAVARQAGRENP